MRPSRGPIRASQHMSEGSDAPHRLLFRWPWTDGRCRRGRCGLAIASRDSCYGIHLTRDHDRHIIIEDDFLVEYSSKSQ